MFYKHDEAPEETMTTFVTTLHQAAQYCNFSDFEDALRNCLVLWLAEQGAPGMAIH